MFTSLSLLPDGTAKEKWKCSTASTPSKRSCQGCPVWRTPRQLEDNSSHEDTRKKGQSKCPGSTPAAVSRRSKKVKAGQTVWVLLSAFARRGRWWTRRRASWPGWGWRRPSGWAGLVGAPWPPPSAGSPPTLPGSLLALHLPRSRPILPLAGGLVDHLRQHGLPTKTCLCQVLRQITPPSHEWHPVPISHRVPGS